MPAPSPPNRRAPSPAGRVRGAQDRARWVAGVGASPGGRGPWRSGMNELDLSRGWREGLPYAHRAWAASPRPLGDVTKQHTRGHPAGESLRRSGSAAHALGPAGRSGEGPRGDAVGCSRRGAIRRRTGTGARGLQGPESRRSEWWPEGTGFGGGADQRREGGAPRPLNIQGPAPPGDAEASGLSHTLRRRCTMGDGTPASGRVGVGAHQRPSGPPAGRQVRVRRGVPGTLFPEGTARALPGRAEEPLRPRDRCSRPFRAGARAVRPERLPQRRHERAPARGGSRGTCLALPVRGRRGGVL